MTRPRFSILVASMGRTDLLTCFLESFHRVTTSPGDYQICVGLDVDATHLCEDVLHQHGVSWAWAIRAGAMEAYTTAANLALGEWLVWLPDDVAFLNGWDDLDGLLREDRALCFEMLEPITGSFPPPVRAGDYPSNFDREKAEAAAQMRDIILGNPPRTVPGGFFGSAILHRSRFVPFPTWECEMGRPYACGDISWFWELRAAHPDLAFGRMPMNCLYHFVRGSIRYYPERTQGFGASTDDVFKSRYGVTIDQAYRMIYAESAELWREQEKVPK